MAYFIFLWFLLYSSLHINFSLNNGYFLANIHCTVKSSRLLLYLQYLFLLKRCSNFCYFFLIFVFIESCCGAGGKKQTNKNYSEKNMKCEWNLWIATIKIDRGVRFEETVFVFFFCINLYVLLDVCVYVHVHKSV